MPKTAEQRTHADRLAEALRYEPCSLTCANWLRYGIQPKNTRPGLVPGACKGKATGPITAITPGAASWSPASVPTRRCRHRADWKAWLLETLGLLVPDSARFTWAQITPGDPDYLPPEQRLLHVVADWARWKAALTEAGEEPDRPPQKIRQLGGRREQRSSSTLRPAVDCRGCRGTTEYVGPFHRRLIAQRRIEFVKIGLM